MFTDGTDQRHYCDAAKHKPPPNPNILISFRLCMHILVHTRVCLTSLLYFLIYAAIRIKLAFYDKI